MSLIAIGTKPIAHGSLGLAAYLADGPTATRRGEWHTLRLCLLVLAESPPLPRWHGLRIGPQASLRRTSLLLSHSELLVIRVFDIVLRESCSDDSLIDLCAALRDVTEGTLVSIQPKVFDIDRLAKDQL